MKISRQFTKAGQDVYETIQWAKRASRITNLDGSVVFEMNDAEIPASWSQLATDIMVSKYFRKAGVPQTPAGEDPIAAAQARRFQKDANGQVVTGPERSAKQVIHRLAGCWRQWGEAHGYFDTAEDAQAFYDELAYMMLTQMAAPNSPQWFNTGLNFAYGITGPSQGHWIVDPETGEVKLADDAYTHPQPHACFIQSCEDDLVNPGGIMDLWTREARLFKYGSGTGTNFSRLRGEDESLSGGGKSSGLMSFLKIGDRAAGAIKSGGTTRRAAKMVCLDLDHPDIEQFINWKVREEIKVAALVEGLKVIAGEKTSPTDPETVGETAARLGLDLSYDFNGEAYATVSGQNSNNSVRIGNAFFRRLAEKGDWELIRRTDGKVARTLPAGELWDQIGYAAWRCADPGVQFDSTINEWHTCPASGRINASNPCVTGDTLVGTTTGPRRIADLVGKSAEVIAGDGRPAFVDRIFKTGTKPVFELKTRGGYTLRLTADHRVHTENRGDVPACELTVDDVVRLSGAGFGDDFVPEAFGELLGAAVGDGCITHQPDQDFVFISLGGDEREVADRLRGHLDHCKQWLNVGDGRATRASTVTQTATGLRVGTSVTALVERFRRYAVLDAGSAGKKLTDAVFGMDRASVAAMLRGLFTADGTVANDGSKSQYIALDSVSLELLRQVQVLLLSFGIKAKLYENRRALGADTASLPDGKGGLTSYDVQQMHSLRISRASRVIFEREIGFMPGSAKAARLRALNEAVVAYADRMTDRVASLTAAGVEDVYDLTEPRTSHFVANGLVVHNCSEYMFLDNTACNLASLNLIKFWDAKRRRFDIDAFEHATDIWTIVLEISVLMAAFPSKEIARLSYEFRTLGLGYANIGAMLMQAGVPYDSDEARAICGAITAMLCGRSYATSAKMAGEHGPFPGFYKNKEHMLRVIRNHRRAAYGVPRDSEEAQAHEFGDYEALEIKPVPIDANVLKTRNEAVGYIDNANDMVLRARQAWDDAYNIGSQYGYRNAQVTVIAPTGTIGLLMDCDTTGVEPDFALVKFKKLAGGGYFKIANQSLKPALQNLGFDERQVGDIMDYVLGRLTLEVPLPAADGSVSSGASTFAEFLADRGLDEATLAKLTAALPTVFELQHAFTPWTVGEDAIAHFGLKAKSQQPGFNLLRELGLTRQQVTALNAVICGTQTVEGAPHLTDAQLPVFDCANTCGPTGVRFILPEGHIRMMAAAQPFISGAISKTINLPNSASVDDIKSAYRLSWELGLKANALYRDGCKLSQPLNSKADADEEVDDPENIEAGKDEVAGQVVQMASHVASAETDSRPVDKPVERIVERIIERPMRRRLPDTRHSVTHKFNVAGHEGYLTVGLYEDGSPGELFITMAKEGSTIGGLMDSLGTAISVALQYGVPVESLVNKFTHQRFEPAGMTHNPDIPFAKSLVDYIFRWMGMEFVAGYRAANAPQRGPSATKAKDEPKPAETPAAKKPGRQPEQTITELLRKTNADLDPATRKTNGKGEHDDQATGDADQREGKSIVDAPRRGTKAGAQSQESAARTAQVKQAAGDCADSVADTSLTTAMKEMQADAPACDVCGTITVRNGTCYKCLNCGNSMGCS